jgi:predicted transcriptional regulator
MLPSIAEQMHAAANCATYEPAPYAPKHGGGGNLEKRREKYLLILSALTRKPMNRGELGNELLVCPSSVTKHIANMVGDGLIEDSECRSLRRVVRITEYGRIWLQSKRG